MTVVCSLMLFSIISFICNVSNATQVEEAEAILFTSTDYSKSNSSKAVGQVTITKSGNELRISGTVVGLAPNTAHGFHIHDLGDMSATCASSAGHYNPFAKNHGGPSDTDRHVGDLGNVQADGVGKISMVVKFDRLAKLNGNQSIIGRAIVLHLGKDDLGKGGSPDSLTTGNAGGRYACGVIGIKSLITNTATAGQNAPTNAKAVLFKNKDYQAGVSFDVVGNVQVESQSSGNVRITGIVRGLKPNAEHGFHIHDLGAFGCGKASGHFNPAAKTHGAPTAVNRHVGDLGNIKADANGMAQIDITDDQVKLFGTNSVLGRSVVVHEGTDDLGLGGHTDSLTTGHAGARYACGVLGIAKPTANAATINSLSIVSFLLSILMLLNV